MTESRNHLRNVLKSNDVVYNLQEFNVHPDTREVYLHSFVADTEEEGGIDWRISSGFIKNIHLLDHMNDSPIIVHMNSIGGEWNYGMAIFDCIKATRSPVIIIAYAHARSMTSIILQAGDLRLMMPNTDFLIHYGFFEFGGNARSAESEVDWSKKLTGVMLDIYVEKCKEGGDFKGWSTTKIRNYLKKQMDTKQEYYMTAQEAVDKGFADGIVGQDEYTLASLHAGEWEVEKLT